MRHLGLTPPFLRFLLPTVALTAVTYAQGTTINFNGGGLDVEANWDGGVFPTDGDTGLVEIDATWPDTGGAGTLSAGGDLVIGSATATNIILTANTDIVGNVPNSVTFNNVTVNVNDDIFTGGAGGNFIFNPGSITNVGDDFEANAGGIITINGGIHTVGLATPNTANFGSQHNAQPTIMNFFGGTVTADLFRITQNGTGTQFGTVNIGGDATLAADDIEIAPNGVLEFSSDWTGSLDIGSVTDWQLTLINAGATLDGVAIDATIFTNQFEVLDNGAVGLILVPAPPLLASTTPADDATGVATTANLVATFDEDVFFGVSGSVTIRNLTNPADIVISLSGPDADGTLSVVGSQLIIDPAVDLAEGDEYVIEISSDLQEDIDQNPYAGILATDDPNWSFTTDSSPPSLSETTPADDAVNIVAGANLVATFDEEIALGSSGTVTIRNLTNPSDIVISLPGPDANGALTTAGNQLIIDPAVDLSTGDEYAIEISNGAVENLSGAAYAGLLESDDPNWTFTIDGTSPEFSFTSPQDAALNQALDVALFIAFTEDIALGDSGTVTVRNLTNPADIVITHPGVDPDGTFEIVNNMLFINLTEDLAAGDEYVVEIGSTIVEDLSGNPYAGLLATDDPNWSFTTDGTPPSTLEMGPIAGGTNVSISSDLGLTFNEDVELGSGTITIHLASDGSVVEVIDVNSEGVTLDGEQVTINPASDLAGSTAYFVTITSGAFTDAAGNPYAGISDPAVWTFITENLATIIFADNFDRGDSSDLNAAVAGKSGALAPLDWIEVTNLANPEIVENAVNFGESGAGGGWSVIYPDHNFIDPSITAGSGFEVSIDLLNTASLGSTRLTGISVGHSQEEVDAWSSNDPNEFLSDFFIGVDPTGTNEVRIFTNGVEAFQTPVTLGGGQALEVVFSGVTNFTAGSSVSYEAFFDGVSLTTGTFTWSGTNENYIALYSNYTANQAIVDNFVVNGNVAFESGLLLDISMNSSNSTLDFAWNSIEGMEYDLVSTTDPEAEQDSSLWAPYNDGGITFEVIPSTGTGTQTLTGVQFVGPKRFFALIERPISEE